MSMSTESKERFDNVFSGSREKNFWWSVDVIRDKNTGVNYLVTWSNNSAGGVTVLVDKDGKPIVT